MKTIISFFSAAFLLLVFNAPAYSASMDGVWLRKKTGGHVQSFSCKGGLGLKIVKSKKAADVGKVIMCGATSTGSNKWKGSLTSTEDGNVYTGIVKIISDNKLSLQGCVLGGLVCKRETWSRLK